MSGQLIDGTFAPGNNLGKRVRYVTNAIKRAVVQDDGAKLRKMVDTMLDLACEGDVQAAVFIRDSLDGKPTQAVEVSDTTHASASLANSVILAMIGRNPLITNIIDVAEEKSSDPCPPSESAEGVAKLGHTPPDIFVSNSTLNLKHKVDGTPEASA